MCSKPERPGVLGAALVALGLTLGGVAAAQQGAIVTDGSLGDRAALSFAGGGTVVVPERLGRRLGGDGANLFHSFDRFEIPAGEAASFETPGGVARIVARVTGRDGAAIDGVLEAFPPVDLYLISPAGIAIGPGAEFRTSGAIHLSTADRLDFADGAVFSADPSSALELTSAPPEAFGFTRAEPGPLRLSSADGARIAAQCSLFTGACSPISLSGGVVEIEDFAVESDFGQSVTVAAAGPGERVAFDRAPDPRGGRIAVSGPGARVAANRGGFVVLAGGEIVVDGAEVASDRLDDSDAPGGVLIRGRVVTVREGGAVRSRALGDGDGGAIVVEGFDRLRVQGIRPASGDAAALPRETAIESETIGRPGVEATGDAGAVRIRGGRVELADSARVFSNTGSRGDAGGVSLDVASLTLDGGAQIGSGVLDAGGAPPATGAGGDLAITARGSVTLRGQSLFDNPVSGRPEPSGFFTSTEAARGGAAGAIALSAPEITLSDNAEIASETANASPAGAVSIRTDRLTLGPGAEITTRAVDLVGAPAGAAGDIVIRGLDRGGFLALSGDAGRGEDAGVAEIASDTSRGTGAGGSIDVAMAEIRIGPAARVTTDAGGGPDAASGGGTIRLNAGDLLLLDGGLVTTSVRTGDGDAGAIDTLGGPFALRNGSTLRATAEAGRGGVVTVDSRVVAREPDSTFVVDSQTGADGAVLVRGAVAAFTAEVEPLPVDFFNAFAVIDDACVATVAGGSALTTEGLGPGFTGAAQPALFGGAVAYPTRAAAPSPAPAAPRVALEPCASRR